MVVGLSASDVAFVVVDPLGAPVVVVTSEASLASSAPSSPPHAPATTARARAAPAAPRNRSIANLPQFVSRLVRGRRA